MRRPARWAFRRTSGRAATLAPIALSLLAGCNVETDAGSGGPGSPGGGGTATAGGSNGAPTLSLPESAAVREGEAETGVRAEASDPDGDPLTFGLGGRDAGALAIDAEGVLRFADPTDFEAPADATRDNAYEVTVTVSDGRNTTELATTIVVTDGPDGLLPTGSVQPVRGASYAQGVGDLDGDGLPETRFGVSGTPDESLIVRGSVLLEATEVLDLSVLRVPADAIRLTGAGRDQLAFGLDVAGTEATDLLFSAGEAVGPEQDGLARSVFTVLPDADLFAAAGGGRLDAAAYASSASGALRVTSEAYRPAGGARPGVAIGDVRGDARDEVVFHDPNAALILLMDEAALTAATEAGPIGADAPEDVDLGVRVETAGVVRPAGVTVLDGGTDEPALFAADPSGGGVFVPARSLEARSPVRLSEVPLTRVQGGEARFADAGDVLGDERDDLAFLSGTADRAFLFGAEGLSRNLGGSLTPDTVRGSGRGVLLLPSRSVRLGPVFTRELGGEQGEEVVIAPIGAGFVSILSPDALARDADGIVDPLGVVRDRTGVAVDVGGLALPDGEAGALAYDAGSDLDGDGRADLAVGVYPVERTPFGVQPRADVLYLVGGLAVERAMSGDRRVRIEAAPRR